MINRSYYVELFEDSDGSRDNHICSGIIISNRWIVTSGKCVSRNNTQPWAFVGFFRYRGGGTSSTWVLRTNGTYFFDNSSESCKHNPLIIYELPYDVGDVTKINITANAVVSKSRPFIIGVSRETDMSERLYLDVISKTGMSCGCVNYDLCVSEANATGHLDEHDAGAALLVDGNFVGVYSHRKNVNVIAFTNIWMYKDWIMRIVT